MAHYIEVCSVGELKPGHYRIVEHDELRIAVYSHEGGFYAFEDLCTHNPCPLSGSPIEGDEIICMMHGARFNIMTGEATMAPARRNLRMFNVLTEQGIIKLELP